MIRFVWTNLVHAPHPSKLIYVDSHCAHYLISGDSNSCNRVKINSEFVRMVISVSFDIQYFSPGFSYQGRTIATPFFSTAGLEDPAKDVRILGNSVYSPLFSRFSPYAFKDFFTGVDILGVYDLNVALFSAYKKPHVLPRLSKHAVVNYYVADIPGEKRISGFFNKYEDAESFARKVYMEPDEEKVKNFFMRPVMLGSIRSCIRRLKHPIGIFAYVQTMAGSINASELLFDFRNRLRHGGGS